MIRIIYAIFILTTSIANAQWTLVPSGTTAQLDAMHFFDSNHGICSGAFTYALTTSDGGATWTMTGWQGLRDYSFVSLTEGYGASVVGNSMKVTTNGGTSWSTITPPTSNSLWGVSAVSSSTAYFVGTGGVFWKTTNGGLTSSAGSSGTTTDLTDVVFTSATTGFIVVQTGQIKMTTNSGSSWTTVHTQTGALLTEMYFADANTGFCVGSGGLVLKTTNGGTSWTQLTTNSTSYLQGVHFFDDFNGIVVGTGGTILYTNDGGTTWYSLISGTTEMLFEVRMLSPVSAVVSGANGVILKNSNISIGVDELSQSRISVYPNPVSTKLYIDTPDEIISINVYNALGSLIQSLSDNTIFDSINFSGQENGVYFIYIETPRGLIVKRVVR